ncbi:hypothetical protein M758_8G195700 [Ceratodon purpureus]|uniref:Uncharacterized protein n=1 Tax=Ceratodon purpureus TaxID=3225 RepID=A0A8T0H2L0_CERPU|nr:hypothetical protein KC19_8G200800 [Ceratodon purpureus]KAG0609584.1 hypothetical protein M758_8G195700 [Ceratodon purpureus]
MAADRPRPPRGSRTQRATSVSPSWWLQGSKSSIKDSHTRTTGTSTLPGSRVKTEFGKRRGRGRGRGRGRSRCTALREGMVARSCLFAIQSWTSVSECPGRELNPKP